MKPKNTNSRIQYLVRLGVLAGVLLMLQATGLGLIRLPILEFTILQVPVIVGAIVMGPTAGGILGGVFGLISFWSCFQGSPMGTAFISISIPATFVTCVITRILMGLGCGMIFKALYHRRKGIVSYTVASLSGALLNTLFFMSALMIFFGNTEFIQTIREGLGGLPLIPFVLAMIGVQGAIEAGICTVLGTAISRALDQATHRK